MRFRVDAFLFGVLTVFLISEFFRRGTEENRPSSLISSPHTETSNLLGTNTGAKVSQCSGKPVLVSAPCCVHPLNAGFHHVYILNLRRRRDRFYYMSNLTEAYGMKAHFWPSIDYKDNNTLLEEIHRTSRATYRDPPFRGHIALRFTFVEVLEHMLANGYPTAMLFEDDIVLQTADQHRFCEMHSFMQQVPKDWDVIYFGFFHKGRPVLVNNDTARVSFGRILCLHHWALTARAARILLDIFKDYSKRNPWRNPDEIVSDLSMEGTLVTYRPVKTITIQQWFIQHRMRHTLPGRHRSDIDMT